MNESSLKYAAYKSMLEGNITRDQYEFINEVGALKMLGSGIKNFIKSLKTGAEAVKKTYDEDQFQSIGTFATAEIKKVVDQVRKIGAKFGKDDDEIAGVLAAILQNALKDNRIEPAALTAVQKAGITGGEEPQGDQQLSTGQTLSLPNDTSVTVDQSPTAQAVVATAAEVSGADKAQKLAAAIQKQMSLEASLKLLYQVVSNASGVAVGPVKTIINYMFDNDLLELQKPPKIESRLLDRHSMKIKQLNRVLQRVASAKPRGDALVFERWQSLAGLRRSRLLNEEQSLVNVLKDESQQPKTGIANVDGAIAFIKKHGPTAKKEFTDRHDELLHQLKSSYKEEISKDPNKLKELEDALKPYKGNAESSEDSADSKSEDPRVEVNLEKIVNGTKLKADLVKPVAMVIWNTETVAPKKAA